MSHGTLRIKLADVGLLLIRCMLGGLLTGPGALTVRRLGRL